MLNDAVHHATHVLLRNGWVRNGRGHFPECSAGLYMDAHNPNMEPLVAPFTPPTSPASGWSVKPEPASSPAIPTPPNSPIRRVRRKGTLSRRDIRRLARRAGIKRMTHDVTAQAKAALVEFLSRTIEDATTYTEYASRKTVIKNDVVRALKKNGYTLYD
jgi:histone H3/H4